MRIKEDCNSVDAECNDNDNDCVDFYFLRTRNTALQSKDQTQNLHKQ